MREIEKYCFLFTEEAILPDVKGMHLVSETALLKLLKAENILRRVSTVFIESLLNKWKSSTAVAKPRLCKLMNYFYRKR